MNRYSRQICDQFRTQPVLMWITTIGTAMSVAFVMLYLMMQQVYLAPFSPESGRERMLQVMNVHCADTMDMSSSGGMMGEIVARECFYPLHSAQHVTAHSFASSGQLALAGKGAQGTDMKSTDADFWKVFDFTFVEGRPYTQEEFTSGIPVAVIDEDMARFLWGTTEVKGRSFTLNRAHYQVIGVVRPVSSKAFYAYAKVWVPYTTVDRKEWRPFGVMGRLMVTILAPDKKTFPDIQKECEENIDRFNRTVMNTVGWKVAIDPPYDPKTSLSMMLGDWDEPDSLVKEYREWLVLSLLLIIPAVNLSAMLNSRLRQKRVEIGIRRSFGMSRSRMLWETVTENFFITLLGGILGLFICVVVSYFCSAWLFPVGEETELITLLLVTFRWNVFFSVLVACAILNLLSCGLPVWRAVHMNIYETWGGRAV